MRKVLVAFAVLICTAEAQAINFTISSASAEPGGVAEFAINIYGIQAGGVPVNNAQLDVLFDTNVFYLPADASRACQISSQLAHLAHTESLPVSPPAPAGMRRLRLNVIDTIQPLGDVTDGGFYFCALEVREDAAPGSTTLTGTRQNVGDTSGRVLPTAVGSGVVVISGSRNADALQPRGGGGGPAGVAPGLEIPGQAPAAGGQRQQPGDSGKTGRSDVAQPAPTAAVATGPQVTPDPGGAIGETGQRAIDRNGAAALLPTQEVAGQSATAATTVSPKVTAAVTPRVTDTKPAAASTKTPEAVKREAASEKKEDGGACRMGEEGRPGDGLVVLILGCMVLWLLRRGLASARISE